MKDFILKIKYLSGLKKIQSILFEEVDNSPLILFRMVFGFLITAECWGAIATGWVKNAFIDPERTFTFIGFEFLEPLPGDGMYYLYLLMGLCGIFISFGWFYKINMLLFALLWAATYLMQKTNYNNHYYLLMLLNFLMVIVPAHRYASLDIRRDPKLKSLTCPRWCLLLFAVQMSIVYFYAGIAKLNPDWLSANPVAYWMDVKSKYIIIGPLLGLSITPWVVAYGGLLFDLVIIQGLWFKKTRKVVFIISVFFHLFNSAVFQVGIFPYLGIEIAVFFLPPEQIRKIFFKNKPEATPESNQPFNYQSNKTVLAFLIIWFSIQLVLPLRHYLFPGNVNWTEEGHRLSWRMMLRQKSARVSLEVVDNNTGEKFRVRLTDYLTPKQAAQVGGKPDMLWQFIQVLKKEYMEKGHEDISIYAKSYVSLNGRPTQSLFDPGYDLAKAEWKLFKHSEWIVQLED